MENIDLRSIRDLENLELKAKQVVEGFITGMHQSPYHGFSVEFAEHRSYNAGENIRHIDWKLYGRTDKLFVKRYEEETNLRAQIVLDISGSMHFPKTGELNWEKPNKLAFSILGAASLMNLIRKQRDAVGLTLIEEETKFHAPAKTSRAHHLHLLSQLSEQLKHSGEVKQRKTNLTTELHLLAERLHRRSLVIIFSDFMENMNNRDELLKALQHFRYNKHDVILFQVHDKEHEFDFNVENRPIEFIDMETGEKLKLHPDDIKEEYTKAIESSILDLSYRTGQYGMEWNTADIKKNYDQVLLPFLLKRRKLY